MAGASGTQTVAAADGRTLEVAEWGDPQGSPVFLLHGTPGSRFGGQADASAFAEVGARVITYDRPGYGGSDRFRGRRVVDCVADVAAIADSLGIQRFAVTGGSSGGPHSLAVAARLPERVTRAACGAGVAPFDTPDFDWFAGMDAKNIEEIGWGLEGEEVLARNLERVAAGMLERVADDPSKLISDEVCSPRLTVPSWRVPSGTRRCGRGSTLRSVKASGAMSTTPSVLFNLGAST
jgi:pimeloyl-ACP methyl ester carboxylesterase